MHHVRGVSRHPTPQLLLFVLLTALSAACGTPPASTTPDTHPPAAPPGTPATPDEAADADYYSISVPPATRPLAAPADLDALTATARRFLAVFWSPDNAALAVGELGDRLAPYATSGFVAGYHDPHRAAEPAATTPGLVVGPPTLVVTAATASQATLIARVDHDDPLTGRHATWLTLHLAQSDRGWLVDALA